MEWAKSMDDIFICIEWEYIFSAVYRKHVFLAQSSQRLARTESHEIKVNRGQIPRNSYRTVSSSVVKCQTGKQVLVFKIVLVKEICWNLWY